MRAYKPFQTIVKAKTSLSSAHKLSTEAAAQVKSDNKKGGIVAILTQKELENNPPEWYKRAAENDSFVEDMKTSKSAWIYHDNQRVLVASHDDAKLDTPAKSAKAARGLAVKTMQALKAKKLSNATWHLTDSLCSESIGQFVNASVLMNYQYTMKNDVFDAELTEEERSEKSTTPVLLEHMQFLTDKGINLALRYLIVILNS